MLIWKVWSNFKKGGEKGERGLKGKLEGRDNFRKKFYAVPSVLFERMKI